MYDSESINIRGCIGQESKECVQNTEWRDYFFLIKNMEFEPLWKCIIGIVRDKA